MLNNIQQWINNRVNGLILALRGKYRNLALAYRMDLSCDLPNLVVVGTHHKTGTAWLMSIFKILADDHGLSYFYGLQEDLPEGTEIFFQHHSLFNFQTLPKPYRGLHMIRDPRDVIISGCLYHQKADEPWLHYSDSAFDGLTYQQKINSLESLDEQISFEMEHAGRRTLEAMLAWDYNQLDFFEVKYEDLIEDQDLLLFHQLFSFLGFPGQTIPALLATAYQNSLFSGKLARSLHLRSGKRNQWKEYFTAQHRQKFASLFGDALIQLGYEKDYSWVTDTEVDNMKTKMDL